MTKTLQLLIFISLALVVGCGGHGKLNPCRDCYEAVSESADTCPHCGADRPNMSWQTWEAHKKLLEEKIELIEESRKVLKNMKRD